MSCGALCWGAFAVDPWATTQQFFDVGHMTTEAGTLTAVTMPRHHSCCTPCPDYYLCRVKHPPDQPTNQPNTNQRVLHVEGCQSPTALRHSSNDSTTLTARARLSLLLPPVCVVFGGQIHTPNRPTNQPQVNHAYDRELRYSAVSKNLLLEHINHTKPKVGVGGWVWVRRRGAVWIAVCTGGGGGGGF